MSENSILTEIYLELIDTEIYADRIHDDIARTAVMNTLNALQRLVTYLESKEDER